MAANRIGGRQPTMNLTLDGHVRCAEFIARQVRRDKVAFTVHVAPNGNMRLTRMDRARAVELPDSWLVGSYAYPPRIEWIEDDLLVHARDLHARRIAGEPEVGTRRYGTRKRKEAA